MKQILALVVIMIVVYGGVFLAVAHSLKSFEKKEKKKPSATKDRLN